MRLEKYIPHIFVIFGLSMFFSLLGFIIYSARQSPKKVYSPGTCLIHNDDTELSFIQEVSKDTYTIFLFGREDFCSDIWEPLTIMYFSHDMFFDAEAKEVACPQKILKMVEPYKNKLECERP